MVKFIQTEEEKERIADFVLKSLPEWFGVPESVEEYKDGVKSLPFWAEITDTGAVGFIAMKGTSRHTAEIYVMGVLEEFQGRGIGKQLFAELYSYAGMKGYSFLQVKTVQKGCYECYDRTSTFYEGLGFKELECFVSLWDENNPCQIYIMEVDLRKRILRKE
ncbi:acetyltransferase (GNAT) family protein [Kineothrix alysoides]|uniref:Acetyltransferase (GNAT) family protein n=1 Tax=Kineothrix alysoides TaxID=1469948 RepID=A0A4R1QQ24_9FIRM|nr:GNAT family N-acetyltransferase [Kineothrix alysoides]TCL55021.1 acetyltransferase (GNAT) family protein [Kineothrix alysoides]